MSSKNMPITKGMNRRRFIRNSVAAAVGLGLTKQGYSSEQENKTNKENVKPTIKEFRVLGRTGFKVSDIGLGAGYLTNPGVLEAALDMGVNYIDTAEHYVRGGSERNIGQVIKSRDRKSLFITSKLNFLMGKSTKEGLKERALKILERLQTDYVDCLMIHMTATIEQLKHEPYHEVIRELKAEGKVRFTGLSNHGTEHRLAGFIKDNMDDIILAAAEDGRFDVVLFVYNFIQRERGERILEKLKEKNMGATLMKINPVRSYIEVKEELDKAKERGRNISEAVMSLLDEYKSRADQAEVFLKKYGMSGTEQAREASIKFVLSHPGVHSICPSINTFEDLETYVSLSGMRLEPIEDKMLSEYERVFGKFYCRHACGLCESQCPFGVPINSIMRYNHYYRAQYREKYSIEKYYSLSGNNASICAECAGYCEQACPYGVPIQGLLMIAHQTLTL